MRIPLFADVLALGILSYNSQGTVEMVPIFNSLNLVRGCTLQGVIWLKSPTIEQRAAIIAQIPREVENKECWLSVNNSEGIEIAP